MLQLIEEIILRIMSMMLNRGIDISKTNQVAVAASNSHCQKIAAIRQNPSREMPVNQDSFTITTSSSRTPKNDPIVLSKFPSNFVPCLARNLMFLQQNCIDNFRTHNFKKLIQVQTKRTNVPSQNAKWPRVKSFTKTK